MRRKNVAEIEIANLKRNFQRLLESKSGLLRPGDESIKIKDKPTVSVQMRRTFPDIPSRGVDKFVAKDVPVYEGEMAEREAKARKEIERKKKSVAIPYNKGGYVYVTPGMDPKTFGRK